MLLVALFLFSFLPTASPCTMVIIDDGGSHQFGMVNAFHRLFPNYPITTFLGRDVDEITAAIDAATACGAKVVNISAVTPGGKQLHDATDRAIAAGVLLVAAAGSNAKSGNAPGLYPGVLAMGAAEGPSYASVLKAQAYYTSDASIMAAATAMLMLDANPALTAITVTSILTSTAVNGVLSTPFAVQYAKGQTYRLFVP